MNPEITVIMSVYNSGEYLRDSIKSILNQTYKNFEFLIIDDCSIDNSIDLIKEYASKDLRTKYFINSTNLGLAKSLNKLINVARGEYIARMDADDISLPHRFDMQLRVFEKYPDIDLIFGDTLNIDKNGNDICHCWIPNSIEKILKELSHFNYVRHPTVMVKKETLIKFNGYNPFFRTGQDGELWIRMRDNGAKFYYLQKTLLLYRLNSNSARAKEDQSYWYKVANSCITNHSKVRALKYFSKLNIKEKLIILVKIIIPRLFFNWTRKIINGLK